MSQLILPDLLPFSGNFSEWKDFLEVAYAVFKRDFVDSKPSFLIRVDPSAEYVRYEVRHNWTLENEKEESFWHVVSKTDEQNQQCRLPDAERAVRIHWMRIFIEQHSAHGVVCFKHEYKPRKFKHYLWHQSENFVVILENRLDHCRLITAYFVDARGRNSLTSKLAAGKPC